MAYLAETQAREVNPEQDAEPGKILHEARGGEMAALGEVPFARYYGSVDATPMFILLAGVNMAVFHLFTYRSVEHWDRDVPTLMGAKIAGGLSCILWIVVVFCGRWIGFTVM